MRGCAPDTPSSVASGPAGVPGNANGVCGSTWDTDACSGTVSNRCASYGDWYGAHEIGHMYGRNHPGFSQPPCVTQDRADPAYPFANGLISGPDLRYFGLDLGAARVGVVSGSIPQQAKDPTIWSDVMTYRRNQWISSYTYEGILDKLNAERASMVVAAGAESTPSEKLLVIGNLNLTKNTIQLEPFMRLADLKLTSRPTKSGFVIVLLNGAGKELARYPFEPKEYTDVPPGEDRIALISEVVPFVAGTERIVIETSGKPLASRNVTQSAPQVTVSYPNRGDNLEGQTATVKWQANDADGDKLSYALLYSANAGKTWQTIATGLEEPQYTVNLEELPGSDRALFRVIATDGVNTGSGTSNGEFRVPSKPPKVAIISPVGGSKFSSLQTAVFTGEANDPEEGHLQGKALEWISNRQGKLGVGSSIAIRGLLSGKHTISLVATEKSGATGKDSIEIEIASPTPVLRVEPH